MAKIYTVEGCKHLDFESKKKPGQRVIADVVHVSCESDDPFFTGREVKDCWVDGGCSAGLPNIGDQVYVIFKPGSKFVDDIVPAY